MERLVVISYGEKVSCVIRLQRKFVFQNLDWKTWDEGIESNFYNMYVLGYNFHIYTKKNTILYCKSLIFFCRLLKMQHSNISYFIFQVEHHVPLDKMELGFDCGGLFA